MATTGHARPSGWAIGWTLFAGVMMIMIGFWQAIAGLAAVINDTFYVKTREYVLQFDVTTWGWIHLVLGTLVLLAGFGVFAGAVWARTVGVILAVLTAIAGFGWMPYYPGWALLIVSASVTVVWALTAHGRDVTTGA